MTKSKEQKIIEEHEEALLGFYDRVVEVKKQVDDLKFDLHVYCAKKIMKKNGVLVK